MPTYRLNRRHFKTFQAAFLRFVGQFDLGGWHLEFHHEASKDAMAQITPQVEAHRADVYLGTEWDEDPTPEKLGEKAKHECLHLLVAEVCHLGGKRYCSEAEMTKAEEELVIRLMKITGAKAR